MFLLDTILGYSCPQDLSQIQSLCTQAILNCEKIRPCLKMDKTHISTSDIEEMEQHISEIIQKAHEVELHWEIKFHAKLTSFDSSMKLRDSLLTKHFPKQPHKYDFEANNAILDCTEKQIATFLKEVNSQLHKIEQPDPKIIPEVTEYSSNEFYDCLIPI